MSTSPANGSYSANVQIRLESGGTVYRVAQVGPSMLIMRDKCVLPPSDARLTVTVESVSNAYSIFLCDGVSPDREIVRFI